MSGDWTKKTLEHEVVRVLAVALEPATEAFVREATQRDEKLRVEAVPDMLAARVAIESTERATIVVVESVHMRTSLMFPAYVHVVALAGPDRSAPRPLGADDIVRRPLDFDELRLRLRLAGRALAKSFQPSAEQVLRELLVSGQSGELVIGRGDDLARIHIESGRLAWVHRPRNTVSMRTLLSVGGFTISDETSRDIVEESRSTKRHFGDVLVDWGLLDRVTVRECLRQHIRSELAAIHEWTETTATFIEKTRPFGSSFAFDPEEVLPPPTRTSRIQTRPGMAAVNPRVHEVDQGLAAEWLERVAAVPNVLGCALLDTRNGNVLGSRGVLEHDTRIAWEMAGSFSALGPSGEELVATTKTSAYLIRAASELGAVAVVCFDPANLSPAMARIQITKATGATRDA